MQMDAVLLLLLAAALAAESCWWAWTALSGHDPRDG